VAITVDASSDRCQRNGAGSAPSGDFTIGYWRRNPPVLDQQYDADFWMGTQTAGANAYNDSVMIVQGNPADTLEVWARNSAAPRVGPTASLQAGAWNYVSLTGNTGTGQNLSLRIDVSDTEYTGTTGALGTYATTRMEVGNDANSDNAPTARYAWLTVHNSILTLERIRQNMRSFNHAAHDAWVAVSLENDADGLVDVSGNGRNFSESGSLTVNLNDNGTGWWWGLPAKGLIRRAVVGGGSTQPPRTMHQFQMRRAA
jgi:hypothetical protein